MNMETASKEAERINNLFNCIQTSAPSFKTLEDKFVASQKRIKQLEKQVSDLEEDLDIEKEKEDRIEELEEEVYQLEEEKNEFEIENLNLKKERIKWKIDENHLTWFKSMVEEKVDSGTWRVRKCPCGRQNKKTL